MQIPWETALKWSLCYSKPWFSGQPALHTLWKELSLKRGCGGDTRYSLVTRVLHSGPLCSGWEISLWEAGGTELCLIHSLLCWLQTPEELDDSDFETEDFDVRSRTSVQTEDDQLIAGQSARVRTLSLVLWLVLWDSLAIFSFRIFNSILLVWFWWYDWHRKWLPAKSLLS